MSDGEAAAPDRDKNALKKRSPGTSRSSSSSDENELRATLLDVVSTVATYETFSCAYGHKVLPETVGAAKYITATHLRNVKLSI